MRDLRDRTWMRATPDRGARAGATARMLGAACVAAFLAAWIAPPPESTAQSISNAATGVSAGVALDTTAARATLTRQLVPGVASTAEIAPGLVIGGSSGVVFTWDILPVVLSSDPVLDQLELVAPAGYSGLSVISVTVGGQVLAASCPNPGANEYCATVVGRSVTILLGQSLADTTVRIQVRVRADIPAVEGIADFVSATVSAAGPRPSVPGDADGNPSNGNSLTVRIRALPDSTLSTVVVNPPVVAADGLASAPSPPRSGTPPGTRWWAVPFNCRPTVALSICWPSLRPRPTARAWRRVRSGPMSRESRRSRRWTSPTR